MDETSAVSGAADALTLAALIINALALLANTVMTIISRRNIELLARQVQSQARHNVFEAHKSLFMQIITRDDLCAMVSDGAADDYKRRMLASMLINHCARIFSDHEVQLHSTEFNEFIRDATDLFTITIVRNRWPEVRDFHARPFREFVEQHVLTSTQFRAVASSNEDERKADAGPVQSALLSNAP
jgi:hypothetical protein